MLRHLRRGGCESRCPLTVLLLVSVFVLGGDFWDKLGALFRYRTQVALPDDAAGLGRHLR